MSSLKTIYEAIKEKLPAQLQEVFLFGIRKLTQAAGPIRIVMYPARDSYGQQRARQGSLSPQEIYSYEGSVDFDIIAPTHEAIEGTHGLIDLLISICSDIAKGSFSPATGVWDTDGAGSQATRGEHYILTVRFGRPVVKTNSAQANPIVTALVEEAPITGTIADE